MKKNLLTKQLLGWAVALLGMGIQEASAQIKWDFDQGTGTASAISTSVPANITVSDFSFGNTYGTVTPMVTNTSASNYTGASANYNATVSANASTPFSVATNTYFTFTLTPATNYAITMTAIQFGARSIAAGPNAYQIYTSADNYATSLTGNSLSNNSSWFLKQPAITPVSAAAGVPLTIRVYGYSGVSPVSGTANWRIDDVAVTVAATMPITLKNFSVALNNGQPQLTWQTAQEINAHHFGLEKSANGKDFMEITQVAANNKPNGDSYQFTDAEKIKSIAYFRIKMVDNDGSFRYSNILAVSNKESLSITAYPNPTATNSISVMHSKALAGAALKIVSINGTLLSTYQVPMDAVQSHINLQQLAKGKYMMVYINGSNSNSVQFDKQ